MNHTPGPLHLVGSRNLGFSIHGTLPNGSDTDALAVLTTQLDRDGNQINAERLVACWNACAGLPDPAESLRLARFALAESIEAMQGVCDCGECGGCLVIEAACQALAAISLLPEGADTLTGDSGAGRGKSGASV